MGMAHANDVRARRTARHLPCPFRLPVTCNEVRATSDKNSGVFPVPASQLQDPPPPKIDLRNVRREPIAAIKIGTHLLHKSRWRTTTQPSKCSTVIVL